MRRLDIHNFSVLLGAALLLFSVTGLYIDTSAAQNRQNVVQAGGRPVKVLRRVYHPAQITRFSPLEPTLVPISPPTGVPAHAQSTRAGLAKQASGSRGPAQTSVPGAAIPGDSFLVPATPPPTGVPPPTAVPQPGADALPQGLAPERIVIPAIQLDAPVVTANSLMVQIGGQVFQQWEAPDEFAAGWQDTSAFLGVPGNTVLNGHHNIYGSVFGHLIDLQEGDAVQVYSGNWVISYEVANKMILPERGEDLSVRLDNARWMLPTSDERLTLVTCWPPDSNTHRLFIVARPVGAQMNGSGNP